MNSKLIIWLLGVVVVAATGCKKDFLEEKRDLTGMNEQVFEDPDLARAYVGYIYRVFQPQDNTVSMVQYQTNNNGGYTDNYTRTTEEIAGQTDWNREWNTISITQNHANQYFGQRLASGISNNVWTRLKQINIFIQEIEKHGLPKEVTDPLKGEVLFWRGYQYFELLKLYGGVPLVLVPQDPLTSDEGKTNEVPRSTSSATVEQIAKDFDEAASLLPANWPAAHWGRITSGAALAMKGRMLLTWASPLFNRNDDRARWQRAYDANLAAKTHLDNNGYMMASNWETMWYLPQTNNPEGVFVTVFNNVSNDQVQRNNGWEQATRPKTVLGNGGIHPTRQMVDAFPMKDGKMPGDATGTYTYDPKKFYKNRDPRFYKTFAYNGSTWPYGGQSNFRLWTYSWYQAASTALPNRYTETAGPNNTGIYVRKATNPAASNSVGNFGFSGTDYMDLRYTEVVLNLAEAAIGSDKPDEGLQLIESVRARVGIENNDGHYGLSAAAGNRDMLFAAVLNERKVEFAYENKRFWDLRRWMLFTDQHGTTTRLGFQPLNGTRRTGMWITVKKLDGTRYNHATEDPLLRKANGTTPVVEREPGAFPTPTGQANMDEWIDYLYENHFEIITRDNLESTSPADWKFTWYDEYYFFGLHQNILAGLPYLAQTQGWPDLVGAMGTFDPLQ